MVHTVQILPSQVPKISSHLGSGGGGILEFARTVSVLFDFGASAGKVCSRRQPVVSR